MRFLVLTFLAFVALAQAERDWSKIKPKHMTVQPRIPVPRPRIVGGQEAKRHSHRHQVAVICSGAFCGGSIIGPNLALTAAHCVDGASSCEVIAGAHEIQKEEETQQVILSSEIRIHEGWDPSNIANDIACIYTERTFVYDDTAGPITLNISPDSFVGKEAEVSGWGKPSDSSSGISPVLRDVKDKIISNEECETYFGPFVRDTNICLNGRNGKGSCSGDSGGPLTIVDNGRLVQCGIVSYGSAGGCEIGYPSVYTRVDPYFDWIINSH